MGSAFLWPIQKRQLGCGSVVHSDFYIKNCFKYIYDKLLPEFNLFEQDIF